MAEGPYSKREVSRAGKALADRLEAQRQGRRASFVAPGDADGERAREVVEWWRAEHVEPMLEVYGKVESLTPELDLRDHRVIAVSFRPKRLDSTIDKLTREPGKPIWRTSEASAPWSTCRTRSTIFSPGCDLTWTFGA